MRRVDPMLQAWPLFDVTTSRAIEQAALATAPPFTLMQRAGDAVARLALAVAPHARDAWIAAGPGNNGGDGLVAAVGLRRSGKRVRVSLLGDAQRLPPDAATALARAQHEGVEIIEGLPSPGDAPALVIDALLGLGASRGPEGAIAAAIRHINATGATVVAVDVPSGLDPLTGQALGDQAVRADHTLALLTLKPGLYTGAGRDHSGDVWLDDLGTETGRPSPQAWLSGGPEVALQAARKHDENKGSFGDVHVVGGAATMIGAALLASRAALAAGAGRVHVVLLDGDALDHDVLRPELMFKPDWWRGDPSALAAGTVLCGCGGGEKVREALPALLAHASRLVLDADALNIISGEPALQHQLSARAAAGRLSILTPHPLEAARLLGRSTRDVQANRLAAAADLARRYACIAVLKGSGSVIASTESASHINPTGNAALATAGTGDVLGGWLAGTWAQMAGGRAADAHFAAVRSVFRHGLAAGPMSALPARPLRAADLIERMFTLD